MDPTPTSQPQSMLPQQQGCCGPAGGMQPVLTGQSQPVLTGQQCLPQFYLPSGVSMQPVTCSSPGMNNPVAMLPPLWQPPAQTTPMMQVTVEHYQQLMKDCSLF